MELISIQDDLKCIAPFEDGILHQQNKACVFYTILDKHYILLRLQDVKLYVKHIVSKRFEIF